MKWIILLLLIIPTAAATFGFGTQPILMTQTNYFNTTNATVNQSTYWLDLFAVDNIYLYNISGILTFNESRMNDTIESFLTSITYLPTSFYTPQVYVGGLNNISYYDDDSLNITEGGGVSPLTLYVNISNVTDVNQLIIREWYDAGTTSHTINVDIWDNTSALWQNYYTIYYQNGFNILTIPIFDSKDHINNSVLQVRFYHPSTGISSHVFKLDWIVAQNGISVITSADHDSLMGRDSIYSNHPGYADRYGYRNFTYINNTETISTRNFQSNNANFSKGINVGPQGYFDGGFQIDIYDPTSAYIHLASATTGTGGLNGLYFGADAGASIYSGFGENLGFFPVLGFNGDMVLQKDGTANISMPKTVAPLIGTNVLCNQTLGNCMNQNAILNTTTGVRNNSNNYNVSFIKSNITELATNNITGNNMQISANNMTMFCVGGCCCMGIQSPLGGSGMWLCTNSTTNIVVSNITYMKEIKSCI